MENKIVIDIKEYLKKKNMTQKDLAQKLGMSEVKLCRNLNATSIKLETLTKLCEVLDVEPGDILKKESTEPNQKAILLFLDYSGTTDKLLSGGAENVKLFFDSILELQRKTGQKVHIVMVTGSSQGSAKSKFMMLKMLAQNYGMEDLFIGVVAEYCGFFMTEETTTVLKSPDPILMQARPGIEKIINDNSGQIQSPTLSYYNSSFPAETTRAQLAQTSEQLEDYLQQQNMTDFEVITYYDEYGKEIDVKPVSHTKSTAVALCVQVLSKKYDVDMVIVGGDSQAEDLRMYQDNKQQLENKGIIPVFIAPNNIGFIQNPDSNMIVGDWNNADGIICALNALRERVKVKEDGGLAL